MVNVVHFQYRSIRRKQLASLFERHVVDTLVSNRFLWVPFKAHVPL